MADKVHPVATYLLMPGLPILMLILIVFAMWFFQFRWRRSKEHRCGHCHTHIEWRPAGFGVDIRCRTCGLSGLKFTRPGEMK